MSDHNNSSGLLVGLIFGAAIGAGITFLFGTKKGKEIREKIQDEYPEVFENLKDKYTEVVDQIEEIKKEVSDTALEKVEKLGIAVEDLGEHLQNASHSKRFVKNGRKL
ncbi:MAG: YtxH domain-containing protein [Patescibacteria group bacterium]